MLSVILPVYNETEALERISSSLMGILAVLEVPFEIIFVNDGSTDDSPGILKQIKRDDHVVKVVNLERSFGQASALQAGFDNAAGKTIVTIDADLENDPRDIINLLEKLEEGYDCVCGARVGRPLSLKTFFSAFGNFVFRLLLRSPVRDMACTLRVYKKETLQKIVLRGSMHRYLPLLLYLKGAKVSEVNVRYKARRFGKSKYGILKRLPETLKDLLILLFAGKSMLDNKRKDYKIASIW